MHLTYWIADAFGTNVPCPAILEVRSRQLIFSNGSLIISRRAAVATEPSERWGLFNVGADPHISIIPPPSELPDKGFAGFGSSQRRTPGPLIISVENVYVPLWSIAALLSISPAIWITDRLRTPSRVAQRSF